MPGALVVASLGLVAPVVVVVLGVGSRGGLGDLAGMGLFSEEVGLSQGVTLGVGERDGDLESVIGTEGGEGDES